MAKFFFSNLVSQNKIECLRKTRKRKYNFPQAEAIVSRLSRHVSRLALTFFEESRRLLTVDSILLSNPKLLDLNCAFDWQS